MLLDEALAQGKGVDVAAPDGERPLCLERMGVGLELEAVEAIELQQDGVLVVAIDRPAFQDGWLVEDVRDVAEEDAAGEGRSEMAACFHAVIVVAAAVPHRRPPLGIGGMRRSSSELVVVVDERQQLTIGRYVGKFEPDGFEAPREAGLRYQFGGGAAGIVVEAANDPGRPNLRTAPLVGGSDRYVGWKVVCPYGTGGTGHLPVYRRGRMRVKYGPLSVFAELTAVLPRSICAWARPVYGR